MENKILKKNLLWLAQKEVKSKRLRTFFTVFAMAFGVGIFVFLTSLGFGIRKLVVSKLVSLRSLKTIDITTDLSENQKLDINTLNYFKKINGVNKSEPLISLIGKIEFGGSSFDVATFGTTFNYLELSDLELIAGRFYTTNQIEDENLYNNLETQGEKEPKKDEDLYFGRVIKEKVYFNIKEGEMVIIRKYPALNAPILGYTKRQKESIEGKEILGGYYFSESNLGSFAKSSLNNHILGKWIFAKVPLWIKDLNGEIKPLIENGKQKEVFGYFGENSIEIQNFGDIDVQLVKNKNNENKDNKTVISLPKNIKTEILINEAVLKLFGEKNARNILDKKINIKFYLSSHETNNRLGKVFEIKDAQIIGVFSGAESPQIYIPAKILYSIGASEFSQIKLEVKKESDIQKIRKRIEQMGFRTSSPVDTVKEVDRVFLWFNIALSIVGGGAFFVALLSMINTITISFLERLREIGIMKVLGMRKNEVGLLIIFQAIIISFIGSVLGILVGVIFGLLVSLLVNIFFVPSGKGFVFLINISWYYPLLIIIVVCFISALISLFPAARAKRISPLEAIRYE